MGHALEYRKLKNGFLKCGLDISEEYQQFNKNKRKYERINETIRDMRTMRVYRILRNKGIELIDPYEFSYSDETLNNINTNKIVKDLLITFEEKYSEELSDALVNEYEPLFEMVRKRKF